MHLKRSVRRGLKIVTGILFSLSFVTPVLAELSVNVSCSEYRIGTGVTACDTASIPSTSPTPGVIYSTALSGTESGNSFSAAASARADYGTLGVNAFSSATNTGDYESRTLQTLAKAQSQWTDTYTIDGVTGLVAVQVDMVVNISDYFLTQSGGMLNTAYLSFITSNSVDGWCLSNVAACGTASALQVGTNNLSFIAYLAAGTGVWHSGLYAEAQVFNDAIGSAAVNINALNTAHSYFTVLTEGASMGWSSGNDYSMPSPVPEPEIYAMMGLGLGFLGWVGRRKKQQATA